MANGQDLCRNKNAWTKPDKKGKIKCLYAGGIERERKRRGMKHYCRTSCESLVWVLQMLSLPCTDKIERNLLKFGEMLAECAECVLAASRSVFKPSAGCHWLAAWLRWMLCRMPLCAEASTHFFVVVNICVTTVLAYKKKTWQACITSGTT